MNKLSSFYLFQFAHDVYSTDKKVITDEKCMIIYQAQKVKHESYPDSYLSPAEFLATSKVAENKKCVPVFDGWNR